VETTDGAKCGKVSRCRRYLRFDHRGLVCVEELGIRLSCAPNVKILAYCQLEKENSYENRIHHRRYVAGVIFFVFALNGFLHFIPLPPPQGVAAQFMGALYVSHYN